MYGIVLYCAVNILHWGGALPLLFIAVILKVLLSDSYKYALHKTQADSCLDGRSLFYHTKTKSCLFKIQGLNWGPDSLFHLQAVPPTSTWGGGSSRPPADGPKWLSSLNMTDRVAPLMDKVTGEADMAAAAMTINGASGWAQASNGPPSGQVLAGKWSQLYW